MKLVQMSGSTIYDNFSQTANAATIPKRKNALIQIGESTHHQDHAIFSSSLSVTNTMVNNPTNPISTLLLLDELFDMIYPPV